MVWVATWVAVLLSVFRPGWGLDPVPKGESSRLLRRSSLIPNSKFTERKHVELPAVEFPDTQEPTASPIPSPEPSSSPTVTPPSHNPTASPKPSPSPSTTPTTSKSPTPKPTPTPTKEPSQQLPSSSPTNSPAPSPAPSDTPSTTLPSATPTTSPAPSPSPSRLSPTIQPTTSPDPSSNPTTSPAPSPSPSVAPSMQGSSSPSLSPAPSETPTSSPQPSPAPSSVPSATLGPTLSSNAPSTTPTVSNEPSVSQVPSISVQPSISPSLSLFPSVSLLPSVGPSISVEPSVTEMPTTSAKPTSVDNAPTTTPATILSAMTFPAIDGQTENMYSQPVSTPMVSPLNVVCGDVQTVLAHPTDANICFAGAANGGVWRTMTCTATSPVWEPLSDNEQSLSIADMKFDLSDTTYNTILVALGARSSFSRMGGAAFGMLYTQNALAATPTWTLLDNAAGSPNFVTTFTAIRSVYARGDLMLAAAHTTVVNESCDLLGIWRSTNRGVTWSQALRGSAMEIEGDPNNPGRFYAAMDWTQTCAGLTTLSGIFTSSDEGATWTATAAPRPGEFTNEGQLNNAKISVSPTTSRVWAALLKNGVANSISYSDNQGASWTVMDEVATPESNGDTEGLNPREKPGGQGSVHFSLLASNTDENIIYVGGDRQDNPFPNYIGARDFSGRLFRGDATIAGTGGVPSPQWFHMTHKNSVAGIPLGGTAQSSAPHADARDMEWRADGLILEGDDGGITVRSSPGDNTGDWFGVCGNMQVFEAHHVAYDPVLKAVVFGNQDTGTIRQVIGDPTSGISMSTADGNRVFVDHTTDPNHILYYIAFQFLEFWSRVRFDRVTGGFADFAVLSTSRPRGDFLSVAAMSPVNQAILVYQTESFNAIYVTLNSGSSFFPGGTSTAAFLDMIFTSDGDFLYAFTSFGEFIRYSFNPSTGSLNLLGTATIVSRQVRRGAVDPSNNNIVYGVSGSGVDGVIFPRVHRSLDAGNTWTDVTVSGSLVETANTGGAVVFVGSVLLVGTSNGILMAEESMGTVTGWVSIASGLPKAIVTHMVYDSTDDILVISTMGRGIFYLQSASSVVSGARRGLSFKSIRTPMETTSNSAHGTKGKRNNIRRAQEAVVGLDGVPIYPPDDRPDYSVSRDAISRGDYASASDSMDVVVEP